MENAHWSVTLQTNVTQWASIATNPPHLVTRSTTCIQPAITITFVVSLFILYLNRAVFALAIRCNYQKFKFFSDFWSRLPTTTYILLGRQLPWLAESTELLKGFLVDKTWLFAAAGYLVKVKVDPISSELGGTLKIIVSGSKGKTQSFDVNENRFVLQAALCPVRI